MEDRPRLTVLHLLFVLFVGLKLTGHIAWSWWWVFAPLWIPVVAAVVIGIALGLAARKGKGGSKVGRAVR